MSAAHDIPNQLERLRRDNEGLERHCQLSREAFLESPAVQDEAGYLLLTACQRATEIGSGLLSRAGLPKAEGAAGVFTALAEGEVLSQECVAQLTAMQGLCDALVDQYEEIDPQWIYQTLQVNLAGLNQFAAEVEAILEQ